MADAAPSSSSPSPLTSKSILTTLAILKGHSGVVTDLTWSPDGKCIATSSKDRTVFVWDVAGLTFPDIQAPASEPAEGLTKRDISTVSLSKSVSRSAVIESDRFVQAVAWSGDGSMLALGSFDGTVTLWSPHTRTTVATLRGHASDISSLSWSPDSKQLASSARECKVWDVGQRVVKATLRGNDVDVNAVAICPDGLHLASGGEDCKTRVWSIAREELQADLGGSRACYTVTGVAWSPCGQQLASRDVFGEVQVWDVKERKVIHRMKGGDSPLHAPIKLAFSPDGRLLAVPRGEGVRMIDVAGWALVAKLQGHTGTVRSVAFSPDGALVATASEDGTARVWGARPGGRH
jgi:WD40 repeat protein